MNATGHAGAPRGPATAELEAALASSRLTHDVATGRLSRMVETGMFKFARVLSLIVWLPLCLLGLVVYSTSVIESGRRTGLDSEMLIVLAPIGGLIGIIGLMRSYFHGGRTTAAGLELSRYLILIGIVTAVTMLIVPGLVWFIPLMTSSYRPGPDELIWLVIPLSLVLLGVDGIAQIERCGSALKARGVHASGALPLLLLAVSLSLIATVMVMLNVP